MNERQKTSTGDKSKGVDNRCFQMSQVIPRPCLKVLSGTSLTKRPRNLVGLDSPSERKGIAVHTVHNMANSRTAPPFTGDVIVLFNKDKMIANQKSM